MEHRIQYGPAYALATLSLDSGDSVMAEAGAMVSMSPGLEVQTSASVSRALPTSNTAHRRTGSRTPTA
jgi:uncharacterized protein (AIM24 family)